VIVLKVKGPVRTDPVRLLSAAIANRLLAFDGELHGKGFRYGDGKAKKYYVYQWHRPGQWISWKFRLNTPANFQLYIKYQTDAGDEGSAYGIDAGKDSMERTVQVPAHGSRIYTDDLGTLRLEKGAQQISIRPKSIKGDELMKLYEIDLVPLHGNR
jgi:hypothetical protein